MASFRRGNIVRIIDPTDSLSNCQGTVMFVRTRLLVFERVHVKFDRANLPPFFVRMHRRPIREIFEPQQLEICAEFDHALSVSKVVATIAECRRGNLKNFDAIASWVVRTSRESFELHFDVAESDLTNWYFYGAFSTRKAVI